MLLQTKIRILSTHAILVSLKPARTAGTVQALYLDRCDNHVAWNFNW